MKWLAILALCACGTPPVVPRPPAAEPLIQLVETAPIETELDSALPDAATVWLEMIAGAHDSIDLAEFYASDHPGGRLEPVVAALETATKRGVRVRFLAEHSFVKVYPETLARLEAAGMTVRHLDLGTGGILHAKYFVIDQREAFLGSQNFDWRALEHNYELGARVHDRAIVAGLAHVFALDWAQAGGEQIASAPSPASALRASPQALLPDGVAWELPELVARIDGATKTIHVQLLTYLSGDWDELEAPLVRATERGVEVELAVADWSLRKKTLVGLQALARRPHVTIRVITIPPWSGGFIPFARVAHAKLLVVDGVRGYLGTGNWEREYFYASRNVGITIDDPKLAVQLDTFFAASLRYSARLDPDATYTPPRIQ